MHQLPETGFMRLSQFIGDPKANPPVPAIIPVSKSSWYAGVKSGRFPAPVKLGPRTAAWRVSDLRALIEQTSEGVADITNKRHTHGGDKLAQQPLARATGRANRDGKAIDSNLPPIDLPQRRGSISAPLWNRQPRQRWPKVGR